jgi:hypothetical protein
MLNTPVKPVIFISYSHKDEPESPRPDEIAWLSFVRTYLKPAVKDGVFDLWVDECILGGDDWDPEIERKLHACDIFVLLVSANSMASDYIIDNEIAIIRERQERGESVHFYPLLLTPTPKIGLTKINDKNLRPRNAKPFSAFPAHERAQHMSDAADEIADIAAKIVNRKSAMLLAAPFRPGYVHISGLPETPYERLVGRDIALQRLDDAWAGHKTNIVSLVAEGGAGKSALINEWLTRMQADNYRDAEVVLGWSFYSQGTKERATSAEQFLNWALDKLGVMLATTSASAKGETIAEALMARRVLLVLDGIEPLQHGTDAQLGESNDQGLRALLRRFAATPPDAAHGLIVISSRLPVTDINHWKNGAAPVIDVERLSDEAGAALLRDNGVWGTDKELRAATHEFGGHPLALGLLASLLSETQLGDVRRRDHVSKEMLDGDDPRHAHARRVMRSYETEWLKDKPELLAIMHLVGLFDRPTRADCLAALRAAPAIAGLTDRLIDLDDGAWRRTVAHLRAVRLLAPSDPLAPDVLDAHPLVREWFGERLRETNEKAWQAAHARLYEYLRDTTKEGEAPTLEDLAPLYQAIAHGCRAMRHQDALEQIFITRICRHISYQKFEFYARRKLGAIGSDLAALSWFFEQPFVKLVPSLTDGGRSYVIGDAAYTLDLQGRFEDARFLHQVGCQIAEGSKDWINAAIRTANLSRSELLIGHIADAVANGARSVSLAHRSGEEAHLLLNHATYADALLAFGKVSEARSCFLEAEHHVQLLRPDRQLLYGWAGSRYCEFLIATGQWLSARERAADAKEFAERNKQLQAIADDTTTIGRAILGMLLTGVLANQWTTDHSGLIDDVSFHLNEGLGGMRSAGVIAGLPLSLLARAAFRRSIGDWDGAIRDLDEVEEIAEPGPMRLFLCDTALGRARLALARMEAFAPLNGMLEKDNPPKPEVPSADEIARLKEEAIKQVKIAWEYVESCGYHLRDEELAGLQAALRGERAFASLPPKV